MIVADRRAGWVASGQHVTTIPAGKPLGLLEMLEFYELRPGHRHFAHLAKGSRYPRVVLLKDNGAFVVAPLNPDVVVKEKP